MQTLSAPHPPSLDHSASQEGAGPPPTPLVTRDGPGEHPSLVGRPQRESRTWELLCHSNAGLLTIILPPPLPVDDSAPVYRFLDTLWGRGCLQTEYHRTWRQTKYEYFCFRATSGRFTRKIGTLSVDIKRFDYIVSYLDDDEIILQDHQWRRLQLASEAQGCSSKGVQQSQSKRTNSWTSQTKVDSSKTIDIKCFKIYISLKIRQDPPPPYSHPCYPKFFKTLLNVILHGRNEWLIGRGGGVRISMINCSQYITRAISLSWY